MRVTPRSKQHTAWEREGKYSRVWEQLLEHHVVTVDTPTLTTNTEGRFIEVQKLMVAAHLWARKRARKVQCRFDKQTSQVTISLVK